MVGQNQSNFTRVTLNIDFTRAPARLEALGFVDDDAEVTLIQYMPQVVTMSQCHSGPFQRPCRVEMYAE